MPDWETKVSWTGKVLMRCNVDTITHPLIHLHVRALARTWESIERLDHVLVLRLRAEVTIAHLGVDE